MPKPPSFPRLESSDFVHYELTHAETGHRSLTHTNKPRVAEALIADITDYRLQDAGLNPADRRDRFNPSRMDIEREQAKILTCYAEKFFSNRRDPARVKRMHQRLERLTYNYGPEGLLIIRALDFNQFMRQTDCDEGTIALGGLIDARDRGDASPSILIIGYGSVSRFVTKLATSPDDHPYSGRSIARRFKGVLQLSDNKQPTYWGDRDEELALPLIDSTTTHMPQAKAKPAPDREPPSQGIVDTNLLGKKRLGV